MNRFEVIEKFIGLFKSPRYLEIGVDHGITFHSIVAPTKVAVDPMFRFSLAQREIDTARYFEMTSDEYFGSHCDEKFDVIFIDGLHTFEQTLRDLLSASTVLSDNGILIIDDVIPSSHCASLPSQVEASKMRALLNISDPSWMGDVYKVVFFIQTFLQRFSYATIKENHGQTVLWQEPRDTIVVRDMYEFDRLSFVDVITKSENLCLRPFDEIFSDISAAVLLKKFAV